MSSMLDFKRKLILGGFLALMMAGCRTVQYVPVETDTQVHIIDSTAIHYLDSIRIYEATRYREMGWLTDTLKVKTERGTEVTVYADTTKELLSAEVKEAPIEEKIHYKDREKIVYKDSIRNVEVPVPVEITKEIKVIPKFWRVMGIVGIILSCVFVGLGIFKLKKVFKIF